MAFSGCSASIAVKVSISIDHRFVLNRLDSTDPLKLVGLNERPSRTSFYRSPCRIYAPDRRCRDDVLCFLKSFRWHDDYVEGEAQPKSATNPIRHFPKISPIVFEDEKINVAVACHRAVAANQTQ